MPELPEVETVARSLRPQLVGKCIVGAVVHAPKTIQTPSPEVFGNMLVSQTILAVSRRAKYVVITLTDHTLLVHLRMTGRLYMSDKDTPHDQDRWVRATIMFTDGQELRFSDSRRFGRMWLVTDTSTVFDKLGPEPLEDAFTPQVFYERMLGSARGIKALLLDQAFLAGVGNIYADESLFRANIHPLRSVNSLTHEEITALYHTVRASLQAGIDHEGASINWYRKPDGTKGSAQTAFFVYGRDGQPCLKCGTIIQKIRVAQRGTHFCPSCQPLTSA